ncbi:hypothetical protein DFH09DRAFT_1369183 [Mycena vulgaris]|nr:hypothetical protein DFH09DRAFT_1369183 [Mycena vulgaris]
MRLNHLDSDVLLQIFALVDVFTVVSLSRVSKSFGKIASSKQLWLAILRNLSSRWLMDPPPPEVLQTFSTTQLIEEVKRVITGPRTWSSVSSAPPTVSRQIIVTFDHLQNQGDVKFLPDGRHFLMNKPSSPLSRGVECWDVHCGRCVWGWTIPDPSYVLRHATFDFRRGGTEAVVCLIVDSSDDYDRMIILKADLTTGESRDLVHHAIAGLVPDHPVVNISGDFCSYEIWRWIVPRKYFLLVNWRTTEFILFDSSSRELSSAMFPGHIVLGFPKSQTNPSIEDHVRIHSIASLKHLWRPLSEFNPDNSTDLTKLPSASFNVAGNSSREKDAYHTVKVSIAESLVHDDSYELVVEVEDLISSPSGLGLSSLVGRIRSRLGSAPSGWMTTLSRYQLTVRPRTPPKLKSIVLNSTVRYRNSFFYKSAAGDGLSWDATRSAAGTVQLKRIVVHRLAESSRPRALPMPEADSLPSDVQMARTGAIMVRYASRIVISYYV